MGYHFLTSAKHSSCCAALDPASYATLSCYPAFARQSIVVVLVVGGDVTTLVVGADGIDAPGVPIVSVQLLARYNSSVDCHGPSVATILVAENREAGHSFAGVEAVEMGRVPSCDAVSTCFRTPGHRSNPRFAFPSSCTMRSPRAQWHL